MIALSPMKRSDHSLLWLGGFMLLSLVLIIVRLWHVQVLSFDKYERYREVQSHRTVRLPAPRGMIFDRQGEVHLLKMSLPSTSSCIWISFAKIFGQPTLG